MIQSSPDDSVRTSPGSDPEEDFRTLSMRILHQANLGSTIYEFLKRCLGITLSFTDCDVAGVYLADDRFNCYGEVSGDSGNEFAFETMGPVDEDSRSDDDCRTGSGVVKIMIAGILKGQVDPSSGKFTAGRSCWAGNLDEVLHHLAGPGESLTADLVSSVGEYKSFALVPIRVADRIVGLLQMKCRGEGYFTKDRLEFLKQVSDILGVALISHHAQAALRERVKELSCLYGIAQIAAEPRFSLDEVLQSIVGLLPPAWQYPEITAGRIILDDKPYSIPDFRDEWQSQTVDIYVDGKKRGVVEVAYTETKPELDEGPFLREERSLIDAVARLVAQIVERKQSERDRQKLQEQLRHADRLATIGQLAAGVAHEFNEPLGNILGFAQLILRDQDLPDGVMQDIDKIIVASMHAREVIKKLMLFARQLPATRTRINLNRVIDEGLYFLESRCTKAGIEMVLSLDPDLPDITADQAQVHQVLVNLVVNAIQAMPDGGTITIETKPDGDEVCLTVTDTGTGMSEEIKEQLFIPFFTTKDVDEGTGLGLPVVHGIVTSHGGSINVKSKAGEGSSFEIKLPVEGPGNVEEETK